MHTYRVWMKDGYAGIYDAETEDEAREKAIAWALDSIRDCAMSREDKRKAVKVDRVDQLS